MMERYISGVEVKPARIGPNNGIVPITDIAIIPMITATNILFISFFMKIDFFINLFTQNLKKLIL